jgi:hypothetical protein
MSYKTKPTSNREVTGSVFVVGFIFPAISWLPAVTLANLHKNIYQTENKKSSFLKRLLDSKQN